MLLRGINVSGQHKMPMAKLRSTCTSIGCADVRTYIQSGNVVLTAAMSPAALERKLETAVEQDFGFSVPVIVRPAAHWERYVSSVPFAEEAKQVGNWVVLALSKRSPKTDAAVRLQQLATRGERVVANGDALWIHYAEGIARSKLTPAALDRLVGSPVTARNWRTVVKLDEMARQHGAG